MISRNELKKALIDMLEQFGANFSISAVENACTLLNHPRTQYYYNKNDSCYCRTVVYDKKEARRRRKLKLNFIDRTNG
jgi:hypothetical protein